MAVSELQVQAALKELVDPNTHKDYVSTKSARNIKIDGGAVSVDVLLSYPAQSQLATIRQQIEDKLKSIDGVTGATANVTFKIVSHSVQRGVKLIPNVKNIIAVASGKGGVGKSTTAVNLALALAAEGARVGMLDADIYGPSQPTMLGITDKPESTDGKNLEPLMGHGIQAMSIGFLIDVETPMVWRGPMVTQALEQLLNNTNWNDLDYLVVDLPPGTSDAQLTLAQAVPVSGAVLVTTPQEVSLSDVTKALAMFQRLSVPVLGVVENMTAFACPHCSELTEIFGRGGGERFAAEHGLEFLGGVPLDITVRQGGDVGVPAVAQREPGPAARALTGIAQAVAARMSVRAAQADARPLLTIS